MKTLLSLALLSLSLPAFAGPSITGGGKGVVCRTKSGAVQSVELLDLWEARTLYKRKIRESREPMEKQLIEAAQRLRFSMTEMPTLEAKPGPDALTQEVLLRIKPFVTKGSPLVTRLKGASLSLTDDSFEVAKPENCAVEQIVDYTNAGLHVGIYVNQDLFEKMSPTQQAALLLHEGLYRRLRDFGETNSIRTRRTVGYVFAGQSFQDMNSIRPATYASCHVPTRDASAGYVYFFPGKDGELQAVRAYDGTYLIGYSAVPAEATDANSGDWKDTFTNRACGGSNANGYVNQFVIRGKGPVDFDSSSLLTISCKDGQAVVTFNDMKGSTVGGPSDPKLACEIVE